MGRFAVRLVLVLALLSASAFALYALGLARFEAPGPLRKDLALVLPKGDGVGAIAERLAQARVLANPTLFAIVVRLSGNTRRLRAGEYLFPAGASGRHVMDILISGATVAHRLTVAEGLMTSQVMALVAAAEGLEGELPEAPPEGALLPETYHYGYGGSRGELIARMARAMERTRDELWQERAPNLPFADPSEALVLASIVEKETSRAEERAHIAGVFINRLRRGMRLQSDPTVAYGISAGKPLQRKLSRADLGHQSPYNTYLIGGLPPGPIANPGRAAIAAVLNPLETTDLYFVADGKGGHAFAGTLKQHDRNVARWRRAQKKAR